ncbi:hypothetical protein NQ317_013618 [Molorchus minor]|uniref:MADF domain-containing protein n=1 Tax=Molorchus minor TaxID=1323400 RepID=A0ABQ9JE32_9CUCU|nr:hypothetical protein NQ317_013618 [Molorchus minor]
MVDTTPMTDMHRAPGFIKHSGENEMTPYTRKFSYQNVHISERSSASGESKQRFEVLRTKFNVERRKIKSLPSDGECKQRFEVLRTKFNVERRKIKSLLSGSVRYKEWPLFKELPFLENHINTRVVRKSNFMPEANTPSSQRSSWDVLIAASTSPGATQELDETQEESPAATREVLQNMENLPISHESTKIKKKTRQ